MSLFIEATRRIEHPPSSFRLVADVTPARSGSLKPAGLESARGRILVIDDEVTVGQMLVRALAKLHATSMTASGREALGRISSGETFDVIVSAMEMTVVSGPEIHERLRRLAPEQADRMIFMTAGAVTESMREFLDRTPCPILAKPFPLAVLRSLVQARLDTKPPADRQ